MPLDRLDLAALRRWVITARADLDAYAEPLNALNVFPVPDGDTGSNLLMTMSDAIDAMDEEAPDDIGGAAAAMARATLVAARGNSGVILSQLARGVDEVVAGAGPRSLDAAQLAAVLVRAAELAEDGVSVPVPGTILTVADAAAAAARRASDSGAGLTGVIDAAVRGATDALLRTRTENDVLLQAGVVDAGGAGYLLVLEALQRVVRGEGGLATTGGTVPEWLRISRSESRAILDCGPTGEGGGPSYEVMFLLDEAAPDTVARLKGRLDALGDSLVIAGGPDRYSVHVHVDDVSAALNAGADAGRPHRFRITRFADRADAVAAESVVLALVTGAGMAKQLQRSGVAAMTDWADGARLGARIGRSHTLLLCASEQARETGLRLGRDDVEVVGENAVQVLAAAAVLDRSGAFEQQCAAAREAAEDVLSDRIVGDPGDDALMERVRDLLERAVAPEILTVVAGDELSASRADRLVRAVRQDRPDLHVVHVERGGDDALLTVGVE